MRDLLRFRALLALLVVACSDSPVGSEPCPEPRPLLSSLVAAGGAAAAIAARPSPFDDAFAAAGREFDVPAALLRAIGWVETRWQMVQGAEEFPGRPAAFGVMALRGERLERGAALAGVPADAARRDPLANIGAAAALLDAYANEAGIDRSDPAAWAGVVARYSGIEIPHGRAAYVEDVGRALAGRDRRSPPPGFAVSAAAEHCPDPPAGAAPDYAPALWRPSPNFDVRAADSTGAVHQVIVHTCEGGYTGCWSWLVNPVSEVSAHYVIAEDGGEISQLVRERDRAWHIAALYDCALNRRHDCWLNGVQSNHFTIGLEHAGFASQDSFPTAQLDASAALVCDISRDRAVPRDWQHIVAHGQLQPENRTDPGPNWPWVEYLHRVQRHCGEIVVDDSATYNDAQVAAVQAPAGWIVSDSTPDYYGAGYRWAATRQDATDGVGFAFLAAAPGPHAVDARWTSGANRSPRARYVVLDAMGDTLAQVQVDQTVGGGRWQPLGTWTFPAGWNRVVLVRRDAPGVVVVADGVRVRRVEG